MSRWSRRARRANGRPDSRHATRSSRPADPLRDALAELSDEPPDSSPQRHHVDDYREFVLDDGDATPLSHALLELNEQTHANRHRLLPEEAPVIMLGDAAADDKEPPRRRAGDALAELHNDVQESGIPRRTHYYSASERREVGEVDRTYDISRRAKGS